MLVRINEKLKADKNIFSGFMAWYGLGCKSLTCITSGHLTGQPVKADCSTVPRPKGRKSIYNSLQIFASV